MKYSLLSCLLILCSFLMCSGQETCLNSENLKALDHTWEQAILNSDAEYLDKLLASDFVWVHNHASMMESKTSLLERIKKSNPSPENRMISRKSNNVKVLNFASTSVVTGFTVIKKPKVSTNYNFMRTYVELDGQCYLLANHTMRIPESEE